MFKKLFRLLGQPEKFYESIRGEGFREPFVFLLQITAVIAIFTPLINALGWASTDRNASFQAQIMAWQITEQYLLTRLGNWAYMVEALLILGLTLLIAFFMTVFLHLIFRLLGGKGSILNAWKAACYGTGPCVLLGWIPYWSLFVAAWSLILQFYYGPKVLYRLREGTALAILAFILGATLLELMTKGTTVGF
jgi:hypothetical protein